jgi:phospholipid/cholesterol/gamma-HCH transport system permease protein
MAAPGAEAWRVEQNAGVALLVLRGDWLVGPAAPELVAELPRLFAQIAGCAVLRFDATALGLWDSELVSTMWSLQLAAEAAPAAPRIELDGLPEPLRRLLALVHADHGPQAAEADPPAVWLARIGEHALHFGAAVLGAATLLGEAVLGVVPALAGRVRARRVDLLSLMQASGPGALGIIGVVNSLVGAILAFVGAIQLQRFGAQAYIANLVGIAVVREMAPIMTAIVMAGRTGGAYAAELATMQGSEEIDALHVVGLAPVQFLVLPRIAALMAMLPVLFAYACLAGLAGGLVASSLMLSVSPVRFLDQLQSAIPASDFAIGGAKSLVFGGFIALSSCRTGLVAGRNAAEVGRAATLAVVRGIIGVIALDAVFALCTSVLEI